MVIQATDRKDFHGPLYLPTVDWELSVSCAMVLYMFGDMIYACIQGVENYDYSLYTDINDNDTCSYDKDGY